MVTYKHSIKGHLVMLLANIIWGLNAPIAKTVLAEFTALSVTTFRMVGAAITFWIFSLFLPKEHVNPKDLLNLFFAALLGVVFNQGLFITGLSMTSPIDAAIVCTTLPILTMIVAAIYLKEPITNKKVLGIFVGAIGALILILSSHSSASSQNSSMWGNLFILIAQMSVAFYLTIYKGLITKYSPITVSKWMFTYASICYIPLSFKDLTSINIASITPDMYMRIFFVVFMATFIAYICMMTGQKLLRPTLVSMYNYVQPIVASITAVVIGLDSFGWNKFIAIIFVFVGVYIVTQSKSRAQLEAEKKQKDQQYK